MCSLLSATVLLGGCLCYNFGLASLGLLQFRLWLDNMTAVRVRIIARQLQLLVQFVCGVTILVVFIIPGRC